MAGQMRVYRQRIRSVQSTKKITRAMELIAASRVVKARQAVGKSTPYALALTRACSAVATHSNTDHVLTTERENASNAGVVIFSSDRGLAGAYSANAMKKSVELVERLSGESKTVTPYLIGRKAIAYYKFRRRAAEQTWEGFTDSPTFEIAREIGERVVEDFRKGAENGGIDEVHLVYTRFVNMVTQEPVVLRLLPLEVSDSEDGDIDGDGKPDPVAPLYEFEPSAEQVLDSLLPRYVTARIFNAMLQAAASELAARQRAMKSATDNAEELIKTYSRLANQARQAEITQEISEIVGGASALEDAS